jgi:hypothetical protein
VSACDVGKTALRLSIFFTRSSEALVSVSLTVQRVQRQEKPKVSLRD